MKKNFRILSMALAFLMIFTNMNTYASTNEKDKVIQSVNEITSNINGKSTTTGITESGADYTVTVEPVFKKATSSSDYMSMDSTESITKTWKVSYISGVVNCWFYMDVSNNQVVRAYDEQFIGLIFTDVLTTTLTEAKYALTFGLAVGGLGLSFKGWLKGIVTGSNNDIYVRWAF
jgi:hypothetical protein